MIIIETILALSLLGLIAFSASVFCIFGAAYSFKRDMSTATVWLVIGIVACVVAFFGPAKATFDSVVNGTFAWGAFALAASKFIGFWILGGLVTAFFYWMSKVKDLKNEWSRKTEAYLSKMQDTNIEAATKLVIAKLQAFVSVIGNAVPLNLPKEWYVPKPVRVEDETDTTFNRRMYEWESRTSVSRMNLPSGLDSMTQEDREAAMQALRRELPPPASKNKAEIVYAGVVWPVTALSLVFADLMRHVIDYMFTFYREFLDNAGKKVFGEV